MLHFSPARRFRSSVHLTVTCLKTNHSPWCALSTHSPHLLKQDSSHGGKRRQRDNRTPCRRGHGEEDESTKSHSLVSGERHFIWKGRAQQHAIFAPSSGVQRCAYIHYSDCHGKISIVEGWKRMKHPIQTDDGPLADTLLTLNNITQRLPHHLHFPKNMAM